MVERSTILHELGSLIEARKAERPSGSYTTTLFDGGIDAIGAKVLEEAGELVEAGRACDGQAPRGLEHKAVVHEAADLVYHLLVILAQCDVSLSEVEEELTRRSGTSGLEEKASRGMP